MKVLHTSDWHFGRTLHGVDLAPAIDLFCQWLVDVVRSEAVDVVLVSGDIYDRSIPSVTAIRQLEQILTHLADYTTVVLTAGNHDSSTRLGFASALMRPEIQLVTSVDNVGHALDMTNSAGERLLVYPLPYLEPETTRYQLSQRVADLQADGTSPRTSEEKGKSTEAEILGEAGVPELIGRSHQAVLNAAMSLVQADLSQRRHSGDNAPAIVMVHAFITGGHSSDSERIIEVGGVEDVAATTFDLDMDHGIDYVAAGHLHRPQNIHGAHMPIRYSGSPVAYSFSEAGAIKSVTLIDIQPGSPGQAAQVEVRHLPTPVWRELATISGTLEEVLSDRYAHQRQCFTSITITEDSRPAHLKKRVLDVFPYAVSIAHVPTHQVRLSQAPNHRDRRSDADICTTFFSDVGGRALQPEEEAVMKQLFEDIRLEESQA